MPSVTQAEVTDWLDRYFRAWHAADAGEASALFAVDAVYVVTPYEEPWPEGDRMSGRDEIAAFWHWVTHERLRLYDGGYDLWAVRGSEAYARWWADIEVRSDGYWVEAEGVFKLSFSDRTGDHLLCGGLHEWNPIEPESARHYEPYPGDPS